MDKDLDKELIVLDSPAALSAEEPVPKKDIGDRMKEYENQTRTYLLPFQPALIRIDGHCFSKFTSGLEKPYEEWMHNLMVLTTQALIAEFNCCIGYTQSDEITLVMLPSLDKSGKQNDYPFANQIQKIVSLSSGLATNVFTNGINKGILDGSIDLTKYSEITQSKLKNAKCYFDSRAFNVPTIEEAYSNLYWRSSKDCIRNSVSSVAQVHFSSNEMMGVNTTKKIERLLTEKHVDWHKDFSNHFKYGTFIKRKLIESILPEEFKKFHSKDSEKSKIIRKVSIAFACNLIDIHKNKQEFRQFLFSKSVTEDSLESSKETFNIQELYEIN